LSTDAVHDKVRDVAPTFEVARFVGADGGCVSEQAAVAIITADCVDRLPEASYASTAIVYVVPHESPVTV
jgi:hypothetical protein